MSDDGLPGLVMLVALALALFVLMAASVWALVKLLTCLFSVASVLVQA